MVRVDVSNVTRISPIIMVGSGGMGPCTIGGTHVPLFMIMGGRVYIYIILYIYVYKSPFVEACCQNCTLNA